MPMSSGATGEKTAADGRYRALLDASIAIAEQPTVKAVLHSLRGVLSRSCRLHGAHLWVLSGDGNKLQVMEFDREADAPPIQTGTTISCIGAVAQVLEEQKPLFVPDISVEMFLHPALAPFAPESVGRSTYLFPVSTAHNRYGVLVVTKERGEEFLAEDVDLLRSLASHVAVALESALATDRAERYQRELAKERDRLRLLLEINNDVVSQLEISDVFRSVSASLRAYFGNDFTGVWLINRESNQLESVLLDFPTGKGVLADITPKDLTEEDFNRFRARQPEFWSVAEIEKLPPPIAENLKAESIRSIAITPLVTASGPLGVLAMGSRKPDAFGQEDLNLLSQIGAQSALALDNALAYGRLSRLARASRRAALIPRVGDPRRVQL
jgi:formate hydrogenlyase transcriptional activator